MLTISEQVKRTYEVELQKEMALSDLARERVIERSSHEHTRGPHGSREAGERNGASTINSTDRGSGRDAPLNFSKQGPPQPKQLGRLHTALPVTSNLVSSAGSSIAADATIVSPSGEIVSPQSPPSPHSPLDAGQSSKPSPHKESRTIDRISLKSIRRAKRQRTEAETEQRTENASKRPTKAQKDREGHNFYDLSYYNNVSPPPSRPDRRIREALSGFSRLVRGYQDTRSKEPKQKPDQDLRESLQRLSVHPKITDSYIKEARVLESTGALRIIIDNPHDFPGDVVSDARILYRRWRVGDIEHDLLRGLEPSNKQKRETIRLGSGHLENGQWWPTRMCMLRDGAHGSAQAGIAGHGGCAYSVVISGGGDEQGEYEDEDRGEFVRYTGTRSDTQESSLSTKMMEQSMKKNICVRLFRSSKSGSVYAPEEGIRYDGLYDIVGETVIDEALSHKVFDLRRRPNQGPIRCRSEGAQIAKPSQAELDLFRTLKALRKASSK